MKAAAGALAKENKLDYVVVNDSLAAIEPTGMQGTKQQMALRRFLYATEEFDITAAVIARMDADFVKRGGVLLFHHLTKHASLSNTSDGIRWSFDLRYHPTGQATGRPLFPGFVARSRKDSASTLTDPDEWANLWRRARARLAEIEDPGSFVRWTGEEEVCA